MTPEGSRFLGLSFLIPCAILVGYGIGYGLDRLFATHFLYIVFLILGAVAGLIGMVREAQKKP